MKKLSPHLSQLITILNDGECHSDIELSEQLQITCATIWKLMNALADYQITIESVPSKGYRMQQPIFTLDAATILDHAHLHPLTPILEIFSSIGSTQDYLKPKNALRSSPLICFAEHQTQGRGRIGRQWHSPFGVNLFLSCLWPIQKELSELGGLSLAIGLSMIRALEEYGFKEKLQLKWPNDIYCHDKKLAGILIEVKTETPGATQVLIGIGLNINMREALTSNINQTWTSLYQHTQCDHDRNKLAGLLLHWLFDYLHEFERYSLKQFLPLWKKYDYLKDRVITLQRGDHETTGVAMGINDQGQLLLKVGSEILPFASGDASVKKPVTV